MSNRISIVRGTSHTQDVDLVDIDGEPIPLVDLAEATAEITVRADPAIAVNTILFDTTNNATSIAFIPGESALRLIFAPEDTEDLDLGTLFYRISILFEDGTLSNIIEWAPFDIILGGSASVTPPSFNNTVKIDHNYQLSDDLTYTTPGGSPIENAQIRIYTKTAYDNNDLTTPVGITTTDNAGRWTNPILVTPGYSYVVRFEKPYEYGPDVKEIVA